MRIKDRQARQDQEADFKALEHSLTQANRHTMQKTFDKFMELAINLAGADGGILRMWDSQNDQLVVRSVQGKIRQWFAPNFSYDLNRQLHFGDSASPAVQVWRTRKGLFIPDWQTSHYRHMLLDEFPEEERFEAEIAPQVRQWWDKELKALMVLPILSGDMSVGVISLHSRHRYAFDETRKTAVEQLLHRIRWFMHAMYLLDRKEIEQQAWEHAILHELRSEIDPLNQWLSMTANTSTPEQVMTYLQDVRQLGLALSDLADNFMDLDGHPPEEPGALFDNPRQALQTVLSLIFL